MNLRKDQPEWYLTLEVSLRVSVWDITDMAMEGLKESFPDHDYDTMYDRNDTVNFSLYLLTGHKRLSLKVKDKVCKTIKSNIEKDYRYSNVHVYPSDEGIDSYTE